MRVLSALSTAVLTLAPSLAYAGSSLHLELGGNDPAPLNTALKMVLVLTGLALAPAVLLTTTSFVRIAVVLSFLRNALGTQNMPPTQVIMGLALFLTAAVMAPVGHDLYERGLGPYLDGKMEAAPALEAGSAPLRGFMLKQTRQADLTLFYEISKAPLPQDADDVAMHLLIPAFVISELRTAFEMGFIVFMPFLVVDLVVASILMALGMVMIPPSLVSLPLKIMLFVLADGWNVLVGSLVRSFA